MSGLPAWARVGAQVVYVQDVSDDDHSSAPIVGAKYTIRKTGYDEYSLEAGIWLVEITTTPVKTKHYGVVERGFKIEGFRPLVTKSQDEDVAQFLPLLTPKLRVDA